MNKGLYSSRFLREQRQACKEQANQTCEVCGATEGEMRVSRRTGKRYILYLHAAHTAGDPQDTSPDLICLCPSCHMRRDRQEESQERKSCRRRGYQLTTTDTLVQALCIAGLELIEQADGYEWHVDSLSGKSTSAVHAVADAIYHLRQHDNSQGRQHA